MPRGLPETPRTDLPKGTNRQRSEESHGQEDHQTIITAQRDGAIAHCHSIKTGTRLLYTCGALEVVTTRAFLIKYQDHLGSNRAWVVGTRTSPRLTAR